MWDAEEEPEEKSCGKGGKRLWELWKIVAGKGSLGSERIVNDQTAENKHRVVQNEDAQLLTISLYQLGCSKMSI